MSKKTDLYNDYFDNEELNTSDNISIDSNEEFDFEGLEEFNDDFDGISGYVESTDLCSLDSDKLNELDGDEWGSDLGYTLEKPKEKLTDKEKATIAEENIALVHYVINSLHNTGVSYDELVSVGLVGYAKALDNYDKSRNVKFSTYAINCIKNEILFFLRREQKHIKNDKSLNKILSVDKNGNNLQLEDVISEEELNEKSLEDLILDRENREILLKVMKHLKPEEQYILVYRFGLDRGIIKTQKEIADKIQMSQANVSKIQKNCLNKLKLILRKDIVL